MRFCHWGNQPANGKKEKESNRLKKLLQQRENGMIRIQQMKLKPGHAPEAVEEKAARILRIPAGQIASCSVAKQSIDARKNRKYGIPTWWISL